MGYLKEKMELLIAEKSEKNSDEVSSHYKVDDNDVAWTDAYNSGIGENHGWGDSEKPIDQLRENSQNELGGGFKASSFWSHHWTVF